MLDRPSGLWPSAVLPRNLLLVARWQSASYQTREPRGGMTPFVFWDLGLTQWLDQVHDASFEDISKCSPDANAWDNFGLEREEVE